MRKLLSLTIIIVLITSFVGTVAPEEKVPVIIMFKDRADANLVKQHGGAVKTAYRFFPAMAASLPQRAIDLLQKNPNIASIAPDLPIEPLGQTTPWGVERIGASAVHAWNKGKGVNVAVLDTGIDKDHLDLSYVYGYDFGNDDGDPEDFSGHGTHVAGTVAALDNDIGVIGVAPEANLSILKIFKDDGSGSYSDAVEAFEWCIGTYSDGIVGNEVQIISMSWGSSASYGDPGIEYWINEAYGLGILLIGAAGNSGNSLGTGDNVVYPARYNNVIAVAATDESNTRAWWSSTGPAVELSAPGVSIPSTYLNGGYANSSGTSMAAPHVSGTAALVFASNEKFWGSKYTNGDGVWTNVEVRTVLDNTADDLGTAGRDSKYGYGLVDADEAAPMTDVHDVAVTAIDAPLWVAKEDTASIKVTVKNEGTNDETVYLSLTDITDNVEIDSKSFDLAAGASSTQNFDWPSANASVGEHSLKAEASVVSGETDTADNSKTTTVTVKEPSHDVAVTGIIAPSKVTQGDVTTLKVEVANEGTSGETFNVTLTDKTDSEEIGMQTITLSAQATTTLSFNWDTAGASVGSHTLEAKADVVGGETDTADNSKTTEVIIEKTYSPQGVYITKGTISSGDYSYLGKDDSRYLAVKSARVGFNQIIDWYSYVKIDEALSSVTSLTITYDGKYSARRTQKLYIYNFSSNSWQQIDSRAVNTLDNKITWSTPSPASYISAGGEIRLRVYASATSSFVCYADFASYTIK